MKRLWAGVAALVVFAGHLYTAGCTTQEDERADGDASFDAVAPGIPVDGAIVQDGDGATTSNARVRLAHLAPDVGPIDLCWRVAASDAFTGPFLVPPPTSSGDAGANVAPDAAALDAAVDAGSVPTPGAESLRFPSVSAYLDAPSGSIEVAAVSAWDRSCTTARARVRVTLEAGHRATLALVGVPGGDAGSDRELGLVVLPDDVTPDPAGTRIRLVHAALGSNKSAADAGGASLGALSAEALEGSITVPLAARIEPRRAAAPSSEAPRVDVLGYHPERALGAVSLHVRNASGDGGGPGVAWASAAMQLGTTAGAIHTGFIVNDPTKVLAILWCDDLSASCTVVR